MPLGHRPTDGALPAPAGPSMVIRSCPGARGHQDVPERAAFLVPGVALDPDDGALVELASVAAPA